MMPFSHSPISHTLLPPLLLAHYRVSTKLDDVQGNLTTATSLVISTKTLMAEFRTEAVSNAEATAAQLTISVGKLETSDAHCTISTERFNAVETNVRDMNASSVPKFGGLEASIHTKIPSVRVETEKIGDQVRATDSTLSTFQCDIDQVKGSLSDIRSTVEKHTDASATGFDSIGSSMNDIRTDLRDARDPAREEILAATRDETCDLSRGLIIGINSLWTKKIKPLGAAIRIRDEEMSTRVEKLATRTELAEVMKRMELIKTASQPRQQEDIVAAITIATLVDVNKSLADASRSQSLKDTLVTSTIAQLIGSTRQLVDSNRQSVGACESLTTWNKTLTQTNYVSSARIAMGVLAANQQAQHLHVARGQITELTHEKRSLVTERAVIEL
ncbi:hypothetical protein C7974DRAFT_419573 [Boeremia exigua]|uniref:uncharacterized protein n=1 Tax=Boeremia exigua TaxID=749465 RepID=UPI001E8D24A1|nr:uncharacterized protein C7974DRAFT_419573 [Boeremia exigua]KAH6644021.1 hypothetical protein C7974DRAFT_419573 [Boeremia exigua]